MKNKIKRNLVWVVVVIVAMTAGCIMQGQSSSEVSPLFLKNVEALAQEETIGGYCFGVGTVDCPFNQSKVYVYYSPYSLLY